MRDTIENPDPDNISRNRESDIEEVTVDEHILFDYSGQGGNTLRQNGETKPVGSGSKSGKSVRMNRIGTGSKTGKNGKTGKSGRSGKKTSASKKGKAFSAFSKKTGTTGKSRRKKKGGSILVSPFPYLGLAIILSAILFFYGGQGEESASTDPSSGAQEQTVDSAGLPETHTLTVNTPAGSLPDGQSSPAAVPAVNASGDESSVVTNAAANVPAKNASAVNTPGPDGAAANAPAQDASAVNTPGPADAAASVPAQNASAVNTPGPTDAAVSAPAQDVPAMTDTAANTPAPAGTEETGNNAAEGRPSEASPVHPVKDSAEESREPEPVPVESVTIMADTDRMVMCDTLQLTAVVSPKNATNPSMLWFSDDETIARVSQSGLVTSLSSGNVTISTVSSNGITTGFPIYVVGHKKIMTMTVNSECIQNDKVGNKWTYKYSMNGDTIHSTQNVPVQKGQTIRVAARILEHDSDPDMGEAETSFKVDSTSLNEGFEIRQEVVVEENTGKLAGNTATFIVTYRFTDAVE